MIFEKGTYVSEERHEMRGGDGVATLTYLVEGNAVPNGRLFARLTFPAGASIGEHVHTGEAEVFYFLEGAGEVTDDGITVAVKAGDTMLTQSGHSHSVRNTGTVPLVLLAVIVTG